MRCHEAEGLLAPQVSESLDAATQRELAVHLDSCAACRARLQQEYELDRLVMSAVSQATPRTHELVARIEHALDSGRPRRPFFLQWRWPAFAGAAVLVLLSALTISRFTAPNSMHLLCQDAVDDHRSEVVLREPRKWRTSSSEINDLVRRTVPSVQVPDKLADFSLQKARLCGLLDADALHLVYGNGSQQVSVFLMLRRNLPNDSLPSRDSRLHQENDAGISATSFAGSGLGVVVVGNPTVTRNVADQLVRSL